MSYLNRANSNSQSNGESNNRTTTMSTIESTTARAVSSTHEYISLQTDWDLDAAFSSSSQPYLSLKIELVSDVCSSQPANHQPSPSLPIVTTGAAAESISEEWEVINTTPPTSTHAASRLLSTPSFLSPVSSNTSTNSACSPRLHQQNRSNSLIPPAAAALAADKPFNSAQKASISKSKSTVIHKCVSVINKVFNNLARSNSFSK